MKVDLGLLNIEGQQAFHKRVLPVYKQYKKWADMLRTTLEKVNEEAFDSIMSNKKYRKDRYE